MKGDFIDSIDFLPLQRRLLATHTRIKSSEASFRAHFNFTDFDNQVLLIRRVGFYNASIIDIL
jgi:hypothetical protein